MSTRVVDLVDEWDERSFTGGYRALHDLADENFSGVIRAGGAELYMTKGTVVGIERGDIEDFESGGGTAYESPSPALPLLAVMQEQDVDVRAKYYSEETPIAEVDQTLSDGGFTGYIELSENVLSGDYYLVYHAGRSMNVGYVGASSRLIDGDEAFETANDEVGIFKVRQVDIDAIEIPEPTGDPEPETTPTPAADDTQAADTTPSESADEATETTPSDQHDSGQTDTSSDQAGSGSQPDPEPAAQTGQREQAGDESRQADSGQQTQARTDRQDDTGTGQADTGTRTQTQTGKQDRTQTGQQDRTQTGKQDRTQAGQQGQAGGGQTETEPGRTDSTTGETTSPDRSRESDRAQQPADTEQSRPSEPAGRDQSRQDDSARTESSTTDQAGRTTGQDTQEQASRTGSQRQSAGRATQSEPQRADQRDRRTESGEHGFQPSSTGQPEEVRDSPATDQTARASSSAENFDLETRAVPSLDPAQTDSTSQQEGSARDSLDRSHGQSAAGARQDQQTADVTPEDATPARGDSEPTQQPAADTQPETPSEPTETVDTERIEELQAEIDERDEEIDRLESELSRKEAEEDDLREQLESVREERDDLQSEVEQLEDELHRLEDELGAATDAERRMTAAEALAGSDIFIRYKSKGDATLAKAHEGSHRREDVNGNLKLEKHTQFEVDRVSVGGQSYPEFLEGTLEYQFVEWVVRNLLFEIRDTGHETALKDLYDALPKTDRAELSGVVDVVYTEEGQETRSQESFDIILRNRMGNPLLVANINDSREAATESMMENLITAAERVGQSSDEFAGAFLVTRSFFEPPALETASEATQGGLLSRDKRKSFVNLSRKRGYHLCLVEARNENFHLAVPEL